MTWGDAQHLCIRLGLDLTEHGVRKIWGVPRGGSVVAALLSDQFLLAETPAEAEAIVDDIVDSGRTRDHWRKMFPGKPFLTLVERGDSWVVFPWETPGEDDPATYATRMLQALHLDLSGDGLQRTPERMVKALRDMTAGYSADLGALLKTTFTEPYDQIVVVRNIPFWSLCEHHVLPFHGEVSIGYLPDGHVVGLSKLPRLVRALSRRLQVQERLTQQIALAIQEHLNPRGVGVVVTAEHTCMQMRGVESHGSMRTSEVLGLFRDSATVRAEFLRLVGC